MTANNDWVTPNRRIPVPIDVGKRRVHASGTQSGSGHWFTGDNGKKVRLYFWIPSSPVLKLLDNAKLFGHFVLLQDFFLLPSS